jgi:hypothetical protein
LVKTRFNKEKKLYNYLSYVSENPFEGYTVYRVYYNENKELFENGIAKYQLKFGSKTVGYFDSETRAWEAALNGKRIGVTK